MSKCSHEHSLQLYTSLGTAARNAKTLNFGRMLPSAYEVPAMYDIRIHMQALIIHFTCPVPYTVLFLPLRKLTFIFLISCVSNRQGACT